jgi:hypothetical protein
MTTTEELHVLDLVDSVFETIETLDPDVSDVVRAYWVGHAKGAMDMAANMNVSKPEWKDKFLAVKTKLGMEGRI